MISKCYTDLIQIKSFVDRFKYLQLHGEAYAKNDEVERYLHQYFYHTAEWHRVREQVLMRDMGNDLAHPEHPIFGRVIVHHINPIRKADIINRSPAIFDLENLISVSHFTHNAIHYGNGDALIDDCTERTPGDTTLW